MSEEKGLFDGVETEQQKTYPDAVIGTDMSIDECIRMGYLMVRYDPMTDDDDRIIDRNKEYNLFAYYPSGTPPEVRMGNGEFITNVWYSFNELTQVYLENKHSMNGYCDTENRIAWGEPDIYDLLHLADDVNSVVGL